MDIFKIFKELNDQSCMRGKEQEGVKSHIRVSNCGMVKDGSFAEI